MNSRTAANGDESYDFNGDVDMLLDSPFADALLADGFEDAFVGFGMQFTAAVAIYDYKQCIDILQTRDGMSLDDAMEYFEFNVVGAYVGAHTPVFMAVKTSS